MQSKINTQEQTIRNVNADLQKAAALNKSNK